MTSSYQHSFSALQGERKCWSGESGLTRYLPPAPSCRSDRYPRSDLDDRAAQDGLQGLIAWLPAERKVPRDSVARLQSQVNEGAYSHPCMILARSGDLVFCAPVTSFAGRSIQAKYARARDKSIFWSYVQIQHPEWRDQPPNDFGVLSTSEPLQKPSYLHLNHGFWIEWRYLSKFGRGGNFIRLTAESYIDATFAYFVAQCHRLNFGDDTQSKLTRKITPPPALMRACAPKTPVAFTGYAGDVQHQSELQPLAPVWSAAATQQVTGLNASAAEFTLAAASTRFNASAEVFTMAAKATGFDPTAVEFSLPPGYGPVDQAFEIPVESWNPYYFGGEVIFSEY